MELKLYWQELFGAGLFLHRAEGLENWLCAGVYLRIKSYSGGRTVAYVGQSK